MIKRENIYARYEDQNVKTVLVYANESKKIFYDAEFKNPVLTTELLDLFLKSVTVVNSEGAYVKPVEYANGEIALADATTFTATEPAAE